jgi:hypothetical protein
MKISGANAFTINRLGLAGSLFPFGTEVTKKGSVNRIFLYAQRVIDLCDLIEKHVSNNLVIFGVEQASQFDKFTKKAMSLEGLASTSNVLFSAIDSETIVLPKEYLLPLLSIFSHYNLSLFDIGKGWNESQVISQVLTCHEHDWRSQDSILSKLPESRLFLHSHDDCYLTIETYDSHITKDVFIRALQLYSGTLLAKKLNFSYVIPDFPKDLIDTFWKDDFSLTIIERTTKLENDYLKLGVSRQAYSFREKRKYTPDFWIWFDVQNQKWSIQA